MFEYALYYEQTFIDTDRYGKAKFLTITEELNKLGSQGWELIQILAEPKDSGLNRYFFKRIIKKED